MRYIFMFHTKDVCKQFNNEMPNAFTVSEWNDLNELTEEAKILIKQAYKNDTVYTLDNFNLCFNLQDKETYHGDYMMFIPDEKFSEEIKTIKGA